MAKRSPILGYNHNFRHRGLVFHVQTEDSGIENPHIFTHLFHGGVILSSRKLTYDAGSDQEVVKALMQAQHKAMLKDLKQGSFDVKIDSYFGDHPDLQPTSHFSDTLPDASKPTPLTEPSSELELELEDIEVVNAPSPRDTLREPPPVPADEDPIVIHASEPASDGEPGPGERDTGRRPGTYARHRKSDKFPIPEELQVQATEKLEKAAGSKRIERARRRSEKISSGPEVVVSRPSVIVGAPPKVVGEAPRARRVREGSSSLFGKDLISEKSLDEVILAYLSEDNGQER